MRRSSICRGFVYALGLLLAACATPPPTTAIDTIAGQRSDQRSLAASPDRSVDVVIVAMHFLDLPYRPGGQEFESGFDCSGFTRQVFGQSLGILLPRQADEQARAPGFVDVRREQLRAGDLVFFNTLGRTYSHVGIFIGDGRFIHAPRAGTKIRVESLTASYWARRFTGARRPIQHSPTQDPVIAG